MAVPRKETAFSVSRGETPRKRGTVSSDNLVGCGGISEKRNMKLLCPAFRIPLLEAYLEHRPDSKGVNEMGARAPPPGQMWM